MYMYKYNICIASLYSTRIYIVTNYSIDAVHTVIRTCQRSLALQQSNLTILMWDRVTLCETLYFYYGGTSTRWKFHLVEIPFSLPHTLHVYALISRPFVKTDLCMINNVAYCFTHCGGGGISGLIPRLHLKRSYYIWLTRLNMCCTGVDHTFTSPNCVN